MDPTKLKMAEGEYQGNHAKAGGTAQPARSIAWLMSGIGPRPVLAPEGLAGGTAPAADPAPAPAGDPPAPVPANTDSAPAGDPPAAKPERPEWLPESLWDAEKGFKKQDFDDLVAFKAERTSAEASRPETPDAYEAKLPEGFKLPDGIQVEEGQSIINADDPRIAELRKVAHAKGWSQQDFEDVLAMGIQMDIAADSKRTELLEAERAKLGSRAKDRVQAVASWVDAKLGPKLGNSLKQMMFTAEQIEAFERLMSLNRRDVPGTPGASREARDGSGQIEGYENMTFRQKMLAIDQLKARN